jgi:hypothetical protein
MYFPQTQIETNLYTNGNEYMTANNNTVYVGYYWETSFGKRYTGKSPQDPNPIELLSYTANPVQINITPVEPIISDDVRFSYPNYEYSLTKKVDPGEAQPIYPSYYFSYPTKQDYENGQFLRFFYKTLSGNLYTEINQQDYTLLIQKNPIYLYQAVVTFQLPWQLTGNRNFVGSTNKKIVLNTENQLNIKGLGLYLKEDYTKFYRS